MVDEYTLKHEMEVVGNRKKTHTPNFAINKIRD